MQGNEPGYTGTEQIMENGQTNAGAINSSFQSHGETSRRSKIPYLLAGVFFGILLVKSEVISWFRIQEMFRFQSFHMYGIMGSAVLVGMISVYLIKKFDIKTIHDETISISPKPFS